MKRLILGLSMVAAMLVVVSSSASAAAGLTLAWNACLSDGGVSNKNAACTSNTGVNACVGTFQLDAPILGVTGSARVAMTKLSAGPFA